MRQLTITLLLLIWPSQSFADVSGIYAAFDGKGAEIIHLVESADGTLRGQIEFIEIDSNYDVKTSSRNLTGTARKNAVAITFDAPIVNWFASTTMTGSVSRGVLKLSYSGETGKYPKISSADRDEINQQINAAAAVQKREALITQANRQYAELSDNVSILSRRAPDEAAWFRQMKQEYAALFSEIDDLQEKWRSHRLSRADERKVINIENQHFEVEKKVWDLDAKAQSRSSDLRDLRIRIERTSNKLHKLCDENDMNNQIEACAGLLKVEPEFEAAISDIRKAFDELAAYRNTKKI